MVSANLASQPSRVNQLIKTVDSLKGQVDVVRVFANEFDPFPSFANVEVTKLSADWADNAKFLGLGMDEEIYFSCDDDIIYPPDYIDHTLERMKSYPNAIVTYHGRKLKGEGRHYYYGHESYHFLRTVDEDTLIDVCGTGVTAFDTRFFNPDIERTPQKMADLLFSLQAAEEGLEIVCLQHTMGWLRSQRVDDPIYREQMDDCKLQSQYADSIYELKY